MNRGKKKKTKAHKIIELKIDWYMRTLDASLPRQFDWGMGGRGRPVRLR